MNAAIIFLSDRTSVVQAGRTAQDLITARKLGKLFTEACTNKRGSLTSKTVQLTPAQIGSCSVTVRR